MADLTSLSTNFFATPKEGFTTTTASSTASGAVTVALNSVTGYTNGAIATFVIEPTSATAKQAFTGVIDTAGVQVTSVVWTEGTNQTHNAGSTVVDYTTATHFAAAVKGLLIEHAQAGTHTNITQADANYIKDTSGNELLKWTKTASAVNEVTIQNAATATDPRISASGSDSTVNLNLRGKGLAKTVTIGAGATTIFPYDYVVSGCVWSGDAYASTLLASMTAGVVAINGNPVTVAAVTARAFTASKDVYVDVLDNGDGTGLLVYTNGTTNAASGALASNSIRIAIIVTGATNIAAATSVNQGQETMVLPIASSIPYAVTDSLGNLICPRDPGRKTLGYRRISADFTTSSASSVQITGLSVPVIVPTNRKVKVTVNTPFLTMTGVTTIEVSIWDGAVGGGTQLLLGAPTSSSAAANSGFMSSNTTTPSSSSKTYNAGVLSTAANSISVKGTNSFCEIFVELA